MEISVDTRELKDLIKKMDDAGMSSPARKKSMFTAIGLIVNRRAWDYAPMSQSKSQYVATLKKGVTKRKVFTRGSLKFSITNKSEKDSVSIFVPANSKAGAYAEKMHDDRGNSWHKLSSGKQARSQDKYIENAEKDTRSDYMKEVSKFIDNLLSGITGKKAGLHTR